MKTVKYLLVPLILLFLNVGWANAHALYIDTNSQATIGETQEVKIYFSEFEDRTVEKLKDWYSDVAEFELWLVKPGGERKQITTTAKEDHFVASFVPENEGQYRLEISHTAEDPGKETAYQFNAFAQVWAGASPETLPVSAMSPELVLLEEVQANTHSGVKTYRTYFKGKPKGDVAVSVFTPSGLKKDIKSNAEGILELKPDEKGIYFLEATSFSKEEEGKTKKAPYKSVWRCATQKLEI